MNYATLSEAFNIESFDKKKKKKENTNESSNMNIEEYKKEFNHCEPLQPPHYKLPISDKSLENYNSAYQVFLKDRKVSENKNYNNENNIVLKNTNNNKPSINLYNNYEKIKSEKIDNIEPYYDEDLDNYLNLSDFNNNNIEMQKVCDDDYKQTLMNYDYKLRTQDSLHNKDEYVLVSKKDLMEYNDMLNNKYQNMSRENTQHPSNYNMGSSMTQDMNIKNPSEVNPREIPLKNQTQQPFNTDVIISNPYEKNVETYQNYYNYENQQNNNFHKTLINIAIFILIGIFIIYLLDLLCELSLNKGMKKTLDTVLPLLEELKELKK